MDVFLCWAQTVFPEGLSFWTGAVETCIAVDCRCVFLHQAGIPLWVSEPFHARPEKAPKLRKVGMKPRAEWESRPRVSATRKAEGEASESWCGGGMERWECSLGVSSGE